jgi:hypothetical protein
MSPQDARRLVGQPDIVERLRKPNGPIDMTALRQESAAEIDRLRTIVSRVRHLTAYTDAEWAMGEIREFLEENT